MNLCLHNIILYYLHQNKEILYNITFVSFLIFDGSNKQNPAWIGLGKFFFVNWIKHNFLVFSIFLIERLKDSCDCLFDILCVLVWAIWSMFIRFPIFSVLFAYRKHYSLICKIVFGFWF